MIHRIELSKFDSYLFQFDQSDLLLPSSEYYKLGFHHPIIQTYYKLLVDVAILLGAERTNAMTEMKKLIEFETQLAEVNMLLLCLNFEVLYFCAVRNES